MLKFFIYHISQIAMGFIWISFESNSVLTLVEARSLYGMSVHSVIIPSIISFIASIASIAFIALNIFNFQCQISLLDGNSWFELEW
jgi:hypothetical protein